jgi:MFS family permease
MTIGVSLASPALISLISKHSPEERIGQAMGSAQGVSALGRVIGPTWGGFLLGLSYQAPFLLTAFILILTIFIGLEILKNPT